MKIFSPSQLIIKYISPMVWKYCSSKKISSLKKFGTIEKDSAGQLLQCALKISDPPVKAALFQHVLEEFHHADIFNNLANNFSDSYLLEEVRPRIHLASRKSTAKEIAEAYAYAHVGESMVSKDFINYSKGKFEVEVRAVFAGIAADEKRHAHGTDDILLHLVSDKKERKWLLFKSQLKINFEKYKAVMRAFSNFNLEIILAVIYLICGPFLMSTLRKRLNLDKSIQTEVFQKQLLDLKGENI